MQGPELTISHFATLHDAFIRLCRGIRRLLLRGDIDTCILFLRYAYMIPSHKCTQIFRGSSYILAVALWEVIIVLWGVLATDSGLSEARHASEAQARPGWTGHGRA